MNRRSKDLQEFVDACFVAYERFAPRGEGQRSISEIFGLLDEPQSPSELSGSRLPACAYLEAALDLGTEDPLLQDLVDRFRVIEPLLEWRKRPTYDKLTASESFVDGHANAMILGPGGIEERQDVWLGVTLLAPNVRYPDHTHTPEEVYLVLSEGEFLQDERGWFTPGVGGSFYNVPHIRHAMRSGDRPFFAFWALRDSTTM
jgi:hypothetical protein